jgi:CubicO group peptidase (beta-lactamase class C family)
MELAGKGRGKRPPFSFRRRAGAEVLVAATVFIFFLTTCTKPDNRVTLDNYFQQRFPPDEPGGAVLIMKGKDTILCKGYGLADLKTKEKITPKTLFNLGSISKTFVANAILMLQEQHKLSVEDSIWKYFPKFKNKTLAQKIKIKHLLTHTSGLPDNRQIKKDSVFYLSAKDEENWYPVSQTDTLVFQPGEKFEYSNPAFNALALIVQQVSGMKWQKYVEENIMIPSGMVTSTITDGPYPEKGVSHGYIKIADKWVEKDYGEEPTFAAAGNGGVWSSVLELEKYEQALEEAQWLSRHSIEESRTVQKFSNWSDTIPPKIGWSWFIGMTKDSLKTIGHEGSQGGFLCNYLIIPKREIHIFILCNTPRDVGGMTNEIVQKLDR